MWHYRGQKRPPFAENPAPGKESVWDYPRPPKLEPSDRLVVVEFQGKELARTNNAYRVLETSHPPGFYIPSEDVQMEFLSRAPGASMCEWKGMAIYWQIPSDPRNIPVGWSYPDPFPAFEKIQGYPSFYPGRLECYVDGEKVIPQPGSFYGGWITNDVVGPFKGEPGTGTW
jgi:uncharacterized protein (DUF427 family)